MDSEEVPKMITPYVTAFNNIVKILSLPYNSIVNNRLTKGAAFEFDSVTKGVTIYKTGHGIIINDHNIKVINSKEFSTFKRKVDVSDGKSSVKLPSIKHITKTNKQDRFTQYGLWMYSKDNIIKNAVQEDWDGIKSNKKNLKWVFNIDQAKIQNKHIYNLGYVLSVPGMFKINNGYAEVSKKSDAEMSSVLSVFHKVKTIRFEISFEDGVELKTGPICKIYNAADSNHYDLVKLHSSSYNALYSKYVYVIKKPNVGNVIKVEWEVSEPPE